MTRALWLLLAGALAAIPGRAALAAMEDDPLIVFFGADQFEWRDADEGDLLGVEVDVWMGYDLQKLWFKLEVEATSDDTEGAELQLLYSRAIDPNWDLQLGLRRDFEPRPERDWFALGFAGLAPYWINVDAALFADDDGQINLRVEAEYEAMLTQRWVLVPEIELNWFSDDDDELAIGAGITGLEVGLRLRYEFRREFAPYVGAHHERLFGETRDLAEAAGAESDDTQIVAGVHFWF